MVNDKIRDLLGLDNYPDRGKIEVLLTDASFNAKTARNYGLKQQINEICEMLGSKHLDKNDQQQLAERIELVVICMAGRGDIERIPVDYFKWNSTSESVKPDTGKIDKKLFEFEKPVKPYSGDKINARNYHWGATKLSRDSERIDEQADGSGAGSTELWTNWSDHSKRIWINQDNEVLHSSDGVVANGTVLSDIDIINWRHKNYVVVVVDPRDLKYFEGEK